MTFSSFEREPLEKLKKTDPTPNFWIRSAKLAEISATNMYYNFLQGVSLIYRNTLRDMKTCVWSVLARQACRYRNFREMMHAQDPNRFTRCLTSPEAAT